MIIKQTVLSTLPASEESSATFNDIVDKIGISAPENTSFTIVDNNNKEIGIVISPACVWESPVGIKISKITLNTSDAKAYIDYLVLEENEDYEMLEQHNFYGARKGIQGEVGERGPQGETGNDGVSVTHSWSGTVLTITSASGTSSADLIGPQGASGSGTGDMLASMYDTNGDGIVDNATSLGGLEASQYATTEWVNEQISAAITSALEANY